MEEIKTNESGAVAGQVREPAGIGLLKKAVGIIWSPSEAVKAIAARPRVLFPILLIALSMLAFLLALYPYFQDFMQKAISASTAQKGQTMTAAQLATAVKFGTVVGLISAPIQSLVMWVIYSAVLFGLVKLFKGQGTFPQYLSITGYAYIIMVLQLIVTIITTLATGNFNLYVPVTSLGALLPPEIAKTFFGGIANGIELFGIWHYVVIGIGAMQVGKLDRTKACAVIGIIYAALLIYMGFAQLTGSKYM